MLCITWYTPCTSDLTWHSEAPSWKYGAVGEHHHCLLKFFFVCLYNLVLFLVNLCLVKKYQVTTGAFRRQFSLITMLTLMSSVVIVLQLQQRCCYNYCVCFNDSVITAGKKWGKCDTVWGFNLIWSFMASVCLWKNTSEYHVRYIDI